MVLKDAFENWEYKSLSSLQLNPPKAITPCGKMGEHSKLFPNGLGSERLDDYPPKYQPGV